MCLEWFGLRQFFSLLIYYLYRLIEFNYYVAYFSENWEYICISPFFSVNLLSFLFGQTMDAHGDKSVKDLSSSAFQPPRCLQGCDCYVGAIYLTIGAAFISLLSLWAGYRDSWKVANRGDIVEEER